MRLKSNEGQAESGGPFTITSFCEFCSHETRNQEDFMQQLKDGLNTEECPNCEKSTFGESRHTGIGRIAFERYEQLAKHNFDPERDAAYIQEELVDAAMQYLGGYLIGCWPTSWDRKWYKPGNRMEELSRAGALIAAEIDRLIAIEKKNQEA